MKKDIYSPNSIGREREKKKRRERERERENTYTRNATSIYIIVYM